MITWGISANSHNAALAVFNQNQLVFASDSERFSGIKNDPNLSLSLVDHAIHKYGGYPDRVCWYEKPFLKTIRQLIAGQGFHNNSPAAYLKQFGIDVPIYTVSHHHSHAAAGYYTSTFDNACVVVIDAIGEFNTLSIWQGHESSLTKLYSLNYPNSVGIWYSAMTQRCKLKPNEEEYILMGMAALGDPARLYRDILNEFVDITASSTHPFTFKQNLHRGCNDWRPDLTSQQDLYDIAAATQKVYEFLFELTLDKATKLSNSRNLVLMGGCALNCAANTLAYKYFDNLWIMPAPGDNGSSIGAVLASANKHITYPGPLLGFDMGINTSNNEIVDYLLQNQICGVARGRAEFGPRALGNRSLIADPRGNSIKDRVNEIKNREVFRPFAPAILAELASEYFDIPSGRSSDYMQEVYRCKHPELFPAIVHVDGTSRLQTVQADNSPFRLLLEQWYKETGCPILLNTSLNIKGQPMVNSRADADRWTKAYGVQIFT